MYSMSESGGGIFENLRTWRAERDLRDEYFVKFIQPILVKIENLWLLKENLDELEFEASLESICLEIKENLSLLKQKENPDVTVIIPAHNEERNILQVLLSLSRQKFAGSVEIMVVDNNSGPNDRTAEIAQQCGARVIYYHLEPDNPDKGLSQIALARQKGLLAAESELIISTDADVVVGPEWIETLLAPLKNSQVTAVSGKVKNYHRPQYPFLYAYDAGINYGRRLLLRRVNKQQSERFSPTAGSCTAFRKSEALEVGGYKLNQYPGEDSVLGLSLSRLGNIRLLANKEAEVWVSPRRLVYKYKELKGMGLLEVVRRNCRQLFAGGWSKNVLKTTYSEKNGNARNIR